MKFRIGIIICLLATLAGCSTMAVSPPVPVSALADSGANHMEPRFEKLGEFRCVGLQYFGNNKAGEIPAMWPLFNEYAEQIKNQVSPPVYVGVETYNSAFQTQGKWFYLAGVQVTDLNHVPVGMVGKVIPANKYAVFTHHGKLPGKIGETFAYIYREWLPKSGMKQAGPYDFERYDARFKGPEVEDSMMEIWVPVE